MIRLSFVRVISNLRKSLYLAVVLVFTIYIHVGLASAAWIDQQNVFRANIRYFNVDEDEGCISEVTEPASGQPNTAPPDEIQAKNAQIIIGVAKTDNLGKQGALIGLMVGIGESRLHNEANSNIPVSLTIPHEGVGSDHSSVGVFQQQPQFTWSTIATGPGAINNPAVIQQLMTPAYAAEAFFGSPPGSKAPEALSKGVQNVTGWQNLSPEEVAQKVQHSDPGGAYFKQFISDAQALIDKYYDSSPAIPLPISIGVGPGSSSQGSDACPSSSIPSTSGPIAGCTNPVADSRWSLSRTDQGVDYAETTALPVYAICDGTIISTGNGGYTGWPFDSLDSRRGPFIIIKISATGPFKDKCTYVAEHLTNVSPVGTQVKAGQQIATALPGSAWTEWGWAQGPSTPSTPYRPGESHDNPTLGGKAFARFLRALGARTKDDPGPGPLYDGASCR